MKILVTGGAGFIGTHLVRELLGHGHEVVILDNLDAQVHGKDAVKRFPAEVESIHGDVTDPVAVDRVLEGCDAVAHLAATVGVGQSMYEVTYYTHTNVNGTACLYERIIKNKSPIKKVVVASSMSAYGEGMYACSQCAKPVRGKPRASENLKKEAWELFCPACRGVLEPRPIPESEPFSCESVYALTKRDTEELALLLGRAHKIPTTALRFFNVYGPGQALSNPYTGVLAIFFSRVINGNPPVVYEDGLQSRDFVYVGDVARALRLALEKDVHGEVFNVGTGRALTVKEIAYMAIKAAGKQARIEPAVVRGFRPGDVRHCFADVTKIKREFGWEPTMTLEEGVRMIFEWSTTVVARDRFEQAASELGSYGLLRPR